MDTNPSGGLAVNPLVGWDLIGTTDGANAVVRLEFAISETHRRAVQLIIATPAFRELAETWVVNEAARLAVKSSKPQIDDICLFQALGKLV